MIPSVQNFRTGKTETAGLLGVAQGHSGGWDADIWQGTGFPSEVMKMSKTWLSWRLHNPVNIPNIYWISIEYILFNIHHWIVHFKWMTCMVCEFYFKQATKKVNYLPSKHLICKASWDDPPRHRGPWLTSLLVGTPTLAVTPEWPPSSEHSNEAKGWCRMWQGRFRILRIMGNPEGCQREQADYQ